MWNEPSADELEKIPKLGENKVELSEIPIHKQPVLRNGSLCLIAQ